MYCKTYEIKRKQNSISHNTHVQFVRTWLGGVAKLCKEYSKIESNSSSYILYRVKSPILLVSTGGYIFFLLFLRLIHQTQ